MIQTESVVDVGKRQYKKTKNKIENSASHKIQNKEPQEKKFQTKIG
jgi:hypothetical protein